MPVLHWSMNDYAIRPATYDDLPAITRIYNQAILTTTATFDTEPKTLEDRRNWFEAHDGRHPVIVADQNNQIAGWAALTAYSERLAYADTAEIAVYVEEYQRGMGYGRKLAEAIIKAGKEAGLHTLISRIAQGNEASLRLTESLGFTHIGTMKEVGRKFGLLLDVHVLQFIYD